MSSSIIGALKMGDKENLGPKAPTRARRGLALRDTNHEETTAAVICKVCLNHFRRDSEYSTQSEPRPPPIRLPPAISPALPQPAVECSFLQKFEKPQAFFLMSELDETRALERQNMIEAVRRDPKAPAAWHSLLEHVRVHSARAEQAAARDRLYRRAQLLIPESCTEPTYLDIWLGYAHELASVGDKVSRHPTSNGPPPPSNQTRTRHLT